MRYIFLAASCTLGIIAGLLALPPIGDPNAQLVAQTNGDRLAVVSTSSRASTTTTTSAGARRLVDPTSVALAPTRVDKAARTPDDATSEVGRTSLDAGSLSGIEVVDAEVDGVTLEAPETTTTTTTQAPTTTTSTTTTTVEPAALDTPATAPAEGGVLISPNGVVMPVLGTTDAGWRVSTPCGNEATLESGERVTTVDFVLDPGHGGSETGATAATGELEKALNLRIAEIVEWYLEREGYEVLLTRRSDLRLPLKSRADIANALVPRAFVSIHHNGGAVRPQSGPGTELFVDGGNPEARRLGGILFEEMTKRMSAYEASWVGTVRNGVSTRLNDDGSDLYGIHRYTPGIPSVITEIGYLSNPSEAALYVDNDVQWAHGRAIADGLLRWLRTDDGGAGYLPDFIDSSSSGTGGFGGCVDPAL